MPLAVLLLILSSAARAERYAFLGGGSGEAFEENFLVQDLRDLDKSLTARGWVVRATVGQKDRLLPDSKWAINMNLLRGIRDTLAAAKTGDEALILLHSHGREREAASGQRSHSIESEDRDASNAAPGFDLDAVEPLLASAAARGVKTALVDLSCYSGTTQALKGASCTATLAAPDYVSVCSGRPEEREFNSRFLKLPPPGVKADLESQFLSARRLDRASINLPELSSLPSPAADGFDDFLADVDPLDVYGDIQDLRAGAKPFDPEKLLSRLNARGKAAVAGPLKRALATRETIEKALPALAKDYDDQSLTLELPGRDPLPISVGELSDDLAAGRRPEGSSDAKRSLLAALSPAAEAVRVRFDAELRDFRARRKALDALSDELAREAGELMGVERALYDAAAKSPSRDACRDFKL